MIPGAAPIAAPTAIITRGPPGMKNDPTVNAARAMFCHCGRDAWQRVGREKLPRRRVVSASAQPDESVDAELAHVAQPGRRARLPVERGAPRVEIADRASPVGTQPINATGADRGERLAG